MILKKYLEDNLYRGFIQTNTFSIAFPVLFARKPGRSLRFCIDYQMLNAIIIKNYYPIFLVQEILNWYS